MISHIKKILLILLIFFILCASGSALQVSNSPGIYKLSNNRTLVTHVFYCSMDVWDESSSRSVTVNASDATVRTISPQSFVLHPGFSIPVTVTLDADATDSVIPIFFDSSPSKSRTIGLIEIQGPTPVVVPMPKPPEPEPEVSAPKENPSPVSKEFALPFSIAFTLGNMKILGPHFGEN